MIKQLREDREGKEVRQIYNLIEQESKNGGLQTEIKFEDNYLVCPTEVVAAAYLHVTGANQREQAITMNSIGGLMMKYPLTMLVLNKDDTLHKQQTTADTGGTD